MPDLPESPQSIGRVASSRSRILHGLQGKSLADFVSRAAEIATEVARSEISRRLDKAQSADDRIVTFERGNAPLQPALAVYAHYHPRGRVSPMVRQQLAAYRDAGFSVALVSMSPTRDDDTMAELQSLCSFLIWRRSFGRDFGAWKDTVEPLLSRMVEVGELLLVNDSVLGPVRPIAPVIGALRRGGDGMLGLTESIGGGAHLQSYFLLLRGAQAIDCLNQFLGSLKLTTSKWRVIQDGEIGLSRHFRQRGIPVKALFPYDETVRTALQSADIRSWLADRFALDRDATADALFAGIIRRPLNPTHYFWRSLVETGYPFIKTDLILGSGRSMLGASEWRDVVGHEAQMIEYHLAAQAS
jgi:hypothetical protein